MTNAVLSPADRLNKYLAWLLGIGSWTACGFIAAGMSQSALGSVGLQYGSFLVSAGIVLLIALPATRVALMGVWFLLERDLEFSLIAAFVFIIIIASTLLGIGIG
jgi:uncharacterized membrane protein